MSVLPCLPEPSPVFWGALKIVSSAGSSTSFWNVGGVHKSYADKGNMHTYKMGYLEAYI